MALQRLARRNDEYSDKIVKQLYLIVWNSVADPDPNPDPDPLVSGMDPDPDPSITKQLYFTFKK